MTSLKPWSLAWVATAIFLVLAMFIGGVGVFMLFQTPRIPLPLMGKLAVAGLCLSQLGFLVSTWKWGRYWRHVRWDVQFLDFVRGPEPEYDDAREAWRWGRRARAFWLAGAACLIVTAAFIVGAR